MNSTAEGTRTARMGPRGWDPTARGVVAVVLGLVAVLVGVLLVGSLLPVSALAARFLAAPNGARLGTYTQDLVTYLVQRLRLAAALLLVLLLGLVWLRTALRDLVRSLLEDVFAAQGHFKWPARDDLIGLAAAAALAVALRVPFLGQPMRYDEALTYNEFASRPLYYALSFYPDPNNHLLNTLLVHAASAVLGSAPWVLRLPAFVAGVLLAPATFALAWLLYDRRAALLAAVFVAVSSCLIEYSTNSRGYTLQALCFLVLLCLAIVAVQRDSLTALLLAAFVAALGAYALPTMFYGVALVAAWLLRQRRQSDLARLTWRHLAVSALALGLLVTLAYLPVVLVSGADKLVSNRFVVPLTVAELAVQLPLSLAHTWAFWTRDLRVISALLVLGFGVACAMDVRRRQLPMGVLAVGVCLAIVLVQRVAPFERVWLFLLPLFLALASGGLAWLLAKNRVANVVAPVVLALFLGYATLSSGAILRSPETGAFPDAQAVTGALQPLLGAEDAVLTSVPASLPELQYYFARAGMRIDTLVRPPDEAPRCFVIALPGVSPSVAGWGDPRELGRFSGAVVVQLSRL